jgi:hypothetical protein
MYKIQRSYLLEEEESWLKGKPSVIGNSTEAGLDHSKKNARWFS